MTRASLLRAIRGALEALDLEARVTTALAPRLRGRGDVSVIAVGKSAGPMARGAVRAVPQSRLRRGAVILPRGASPPWRSPPTGVEVHRAGHPLPDPASVRAAERCLEIASEVGVDEILVVLVSGGASALIAAPRGVSLATKRQITAALLRSGAPVTEINVVRKHLSRIKGGGLARACRGEVVTIVASDVIGGAASDVGSGPSLADRSSIADARRVLRARAPAFARVPLGPALAPATSRRRGRRPVVVARPADAARAVASALRSQGLEVRILRPSRASALSLARAYAGIARRLRPGEAVVRIAEPAVQIASRKGRGGRCTHLATLVAPRLERGIYFAAVATDGVDGTSGTGGALVDATFVTRARRGWGAHALEVAIAEANTGPLHIAARTALPTRPSGHNYADLHVLVRTR